ncbi:MAG TPA: universal stress protein [Bryobacteraceae bacterium]|jgi:nucleotide-binding universal stress UspA family protein|nr:universal stress protein [Bryobacteraceae bacterium]
MPGFKHILFPVDFSQQNIGIAPHVFCLARRYRAKVTLLHAVEISSGSYPGWPVFEPTIDFTGIAEDRQSRLDAFLRDEFRDLAPARVMREGDPAFHIREFAEKEGVDLIMMPTHGYGPYRRFLLGSVTSKVLHDVKCPVWTSAHVPEPPGAPAAYQRVLCALDYVPESLALLRWAALLACEHGAVLKLVHAIPAAAVPGGLDVEGGRFRSFLFEQARERLAGLQKEAGTTVSTIIQGGEVAGVVREAAEKEKADLLVIGRGVMRELLGRMRTNVYSIIRESPCPVISV